MLLRIDRPSTGESDQQNGIRAKRIGPGRVGSVRDAGPCISLGRQGAREGSDKKKRGRDGRIRKKSYSYKVICLLAVRPSVRPSIRRPS